MKRELRPVGKHVFCMRCMKKKPPEWEKATFLLPLRKGHYDLAPDGFNIDLRVIGVCDECLDNATEFQKKYKSEIDTNNEHIVYYEVSKD